MKVLKSWGTSGEVVVNLLGEDPRDLEINEPVFITIDGLPVPFFVERCAPKGGRLIVKFEDVDTFEDSEELVGKEILFSEEEDDDPDDSVVGMVVADRDGRVIGPITEFNDYAGNTCVTVEYEGREVILPFHEDLILKVKKNTITLDIPDGLL